MQPVNFLLSLNIIYSEASSIYSYRISYEAATMMRKAYTVEFKINRKVASSICYPTVNKINKIIRKGVNK